MGAVSPSLSGTTSRGTSYSGSAVHVADSMSGGCHFFDNSKVHVLAANEYIDDGSEMIIDASSGLLGTPEREETGLRIPMIFEPKLFIAQKVTLKGQVEPWMNGDYKVISLHHRGTISDAVCGTATTSVGLWAPFLGMGVWGGEPGKLTPVRMSTL